MAIDWLHGFIVPLIEITFLFGIVGWISYIVGKAFWNAWSKQTKFFFRYKLPIFKKAYPEKKLKWCLDCIDEGIGYYDAKKLLMVKMIPDDEINETMWIYDQILDTMKGGINKNGREFKGCDRKDQSQSTELPTISKS